jgi:dipeptidyl aminopeptidase/acylaminoacyl peptidase
MIRASIGAALIPFVSKIALCGFPSVATAADARVPPAAPREMGALVFDGVPEIPPRIVERMNQYQNVRYAGPVDWTPGGGLLISTRFADTAQLHHVAFPGADRRQITFYKEPVSGGSYGNDADWLIFGRDVGGNEMSQIYRFDLATGKETQLTKGEGQNGDVVWSNDRSRLAWRSTARNQKDHDIWMMDPLRPENQEIVLETQGYWSPSDWSPDNSFLLVAEFVSANESYLWNVDLRRHTKKPVGNHDKVKGETISYTKALFDESGKGVFLTSDEGTEFRTLRWLRLGSKKTEPITGDIPWDVVSFILSRDRKRMAFTVNENGRSKLFLMDTSTRRRTEVPIPLGIASGLDFNSDGTELAFGLESPSSPKDVYSLELATMKVTRWTESEVGGLDPKTFRSSELVSFPTFDDAKKGERREIPAFVYKPEGKGPFPVIINIHGGPESQSSASFVPTTQYYLNELGCAVIYPNVRGSAGYGKTFLKLDNGSLREDSVKDIGALLDWIATQPDLDSRRVAVIGGSYGGYMSLACLTHYSDRLSAGVDVVGISDFVTFLENTSEYRRDLRRAEYGDERDPKMREFLKKIAPTMNADKIRAPLFVIQGANDPRVPASEAEQIVRIARENGVHVWSLLAKDEGHGFNKKANSDQMGYAVSLFWETFLLGGGLTSDIE